MTLRKPSIKCLSHHSIYYGSGVFSPEPVENLSFRLASILQFKTLILIEIALGTSLEIPRTIGKPLFREKTSNIIPTIHGWLLIELAQFLLCEMH